MRVTENSLMSLGNQKENVSNKVNSPPIRDFMNERYQDIQLSKSTVQAQSRIIKTESIPVSTRAEL